jgi:(2R)-ethylmalonyl-CoA mutase
MSEVRDESDRKDHKLEEPDRPWVMRTYAGHSDARRSNELYRGNLAKGQTGLSVAFDLPTQTGYDPDHPLSRGEVGKVGVSVAHLGDMETLMDEIPLGTMNTSMTINAVAAWMLGLYVAAAENSGVDRSELTGTTQNDIIKEYLSRGTYAFPPEPSMRLIADMVSFTVNEVPSWNPINICSYHLQEAGATPVQEIAYAISNAIAVLDEVKKRGQVADEDFPKVFGRISFFVNAGIRFVEEIAKLKAMGRLWTGAVRGRRPEDAPVPLRRPGQLPRPDRGSAGEQRPADRDRGPGSDPGPGRAGESAAAAGMERSDGPTPPLGPAVEPEDPAGDGL